MLTVFTSNDIIVLTFTPFICFFAKDAKISPVPYLFCEFIAANTWSMALIIGNPTNIYLAAGAGADFAGYLSVMAFPTLFGGLVSFVMLMLVFRKQLRGEICHEASPRKPRDMVTVIIALIHLGLCVLMLVMSSFFSLPMWLVTLVFFCSLFIVSLTQLLIRHRSPRILLNTLHRAPWEIVPFILSMFVLVEGLGKAQVTDEIARLLSNGNGIINYGVMSFAASNVINNIPMSVLFSSIINSCSAGIGALYASVVGSNLGVFLTPMGVLAGIMWMGMLHEHGVDMSFGKFVKYGVCISLPALAATLGALLLVVG